MGFGDVGEKIYKHIFKIGRERRGENKKTFTSYSPFLLKNQNFIVTPTRKFRPACG